MSSPTDKYGNSGAKKKGLQRNFLLCMHPVHTFHGQLPDARLTRVWGMLDCFGNIHLSVFVFSDYLNAEHLAFHSFVTLVLILCPVYYEPFPRTTAPLGLIPQGKRGLPPTPLLPSVCCRCTQQTSCSQAVRPVDTNSTLEQCGAPETSEPVPPVQLNAIEAAHRPPVMDRCLA